MAIIGNLIVNLKAQSSKFVAAMERSRKSQDRMRRSSSDLRNSLRRAGAAALAFAGVGGIGSTIKSSLDAADKIDKLAIRLGATTEGLSELQHAAELTGVPFQTLTMGLQRMTRRVAEAAQGTGEAKAAIRELVLTRKRSVAWHPRTSSRPSPMRCRAWGLSRTRCACR